MQKIEKKLRPTAIKTGRAENSTGWQSLAFVATMSNIGSDLGVIWGGAGGDLAVTLGPLPLRADAPLSAGLLPSSMKAAPLSVRWHQKSAGQSWPRHRADARGNTMRPP